MHRARRQAATLADAADALAAGRGRARSADGVVAAEVDGHGILLALTLADPATRLPPERLGAAIVETVQAAARDARVRRHAVLGDLIAELDR
ncbi:hypothetical protein AU194_25805 [Mycobacterium sp. GA-2829]|nr:hypothetical protein AU194_25805 [Mycobacterium sp. GA-2829]